MNRREFQMLVLSNALVTTETRLRPYCKLGNFREGLISRNFAYAKFRENKYLAK